MTWNAVEFVFDRNLMNEIYPIEADSISIPIITNQILLIALAILAMPTTFLGSKWIFNKVGSLRTLPKVIILMLCIGIYLLSIFVCIGMTLSYVDKNHIEIGICYAAILLLFLLFIVIDTIRIYRHMYKNINSQ